MLPPMSRGQELLAALLRELSAEFPALRILPKREVWHQRAIGILLWVLTLGSQRHYLSQYTTTLGASRIYTPEHFDSLAPEDRYIILRHERVHLRQFRRYTVPLMAALYLLLPLPAGLAYFRQRFEREGYEETIRASREVYGRDYVRRPFFQAYIVRQFTSGAYGWMWPFPKQVRAWVRAVAEEE